MVKRNTAEKITESIEKLKGILDLRHDTDFDSRCKLPKDTTNRLLRRGHRPSIDIILRIHEATGCSMAWLLSGEGEPFPERPVELVSEEQALCLRAIEETIRCLLDHHREVLADKNHATRHLVHIQRMVAALELTPR